LTIRLESTRMPRLRQGLGQTELLVPVEFGDRGAPIVEEFVW
jgi:hypothetical protein